MSEATDKEAPDSPIASRQSPEIRAASKDWWMRKLYVLRSKSILAKKDEHLSRSIFGNRLHIREEEKALEITGEVEKYMDRADFEQIRSTDTGYQKLVERFVVITATPPDYWQWKDRVSQATHPPLYQKQAEEFRSKADEIASKHNTPRERAQYAIFALRSFIREIRRPIKRAPVKYPKGLVQLVKEMEEMDKQMGEYNLELAVPVITGKKDRKRVSDWKRSSNVERMSRLEALTDRYLYTVTPIAPTKPFQTQVETMSSLLS